MAGLGKTISKKISNKVDKRLKDVNLHKSWGESFAFLLLLTGFVISFRLEFAIIAYFVISLFAFLFGRIYYVKRGKQSILASILAIGAFLIGFLAGSFSHSRIIILFLFIFFFSLSHWLHVKEYLVIFKSEGFLK